MPIRGFPAEGVVACFDEPNTIGDIEDINAPRNDPVKNPINYLSDITFHSDFFQYEIAAGPVDVSVSHGSVPTMTTLIGVNPGNGGIGIAIPPAVGINVVGNYVTTDILAFTHGLGYIPKFMVAYQGRRMPDGQVVQAASGYRRRVSAWANSSGIYLRDSGAVSAVSMPAVSVSYRILVFRESQANPALPLFGGGPGDATIIARGVINSSKKYLRRTGVGDTPFAQNLGRTIDTNNGFLATASGGVVTAETGYGGSLTAPPFISVGVD